LERERAQILDKDRDTRRILKEVDKLKEVKANVEHRLEKFSVFRSYLERTKESSKGEYKDIRELMDRYGVLAEARGTLMAKNKHFRDSIALRQRALEKDIVVRTL
jgi:arginyl-tRNA--protein-N-Asp/Glu arginylyltransferase